MHPTSAQRSVSAARGFLHVGCAPLLGGTDPTRVMCCESAVQSEFRTSLLDFQVLR